jgi:hypothetical protein
MELGLPMTLGELLAMAGNLRYGVGTDEKERLAISRALPGAPRDTSADQDAANRYASGYLFGLNHPTIAAAVQPFVSQLKTSDLPLFGGSTPELQSQADSGVQQGVAAASRGMSIKDLLDRLSLVGAGQ